ncbi:MAG: HDOD domain-containing protein, partial [Alphaproteobacteria bacterium]|nr:HDOD domain-containing protein [Alphaproteobacteria bacterium]
HALLVEAEQAEFGANHGEVGAYLLGLWGFSDSIVEAIAHHHRPSLYTRTPAPVLIALHAAQYLTRVYGGRSAQRVHVDALDTEYLAAAGLSGRLPEWQKVFENLSGTWSHD